MDEMTVVKRYGLTELIKANYLSFILLPLGMGLFLCGITAVLASLAVSYSLFLGFVVGTMDVVILITGIRRALPYVKIPKKGLSIMSRYRWYRIIAAGTIMVLLSKQGFSVAPAFIGFLLTHIFFIFNLILIAYRLKDEDT